MYACVLCSQSINVFVRSKEVKQNTNIRKKDSIIYRKITKEIVIDKMQKGGRDIHLSNVGCYPTNWSRLGLNKTTLEFDASTLPDENDA